MKFYRVKALLIRHLYLYQRSVPRLMDFFWPVLEVLLWGFLSLYLQKLNLSNVNIITVLLGAIIFWDLMSQAQRAISTSFLEEVWEKNLLNIFVTPLKVSEFLLAGILVGIVRMTGVGLVMSVLAFWLYHLNILAMGFYLIPLVANLLIFGWTLGLFSTTVILRFGTSAQVLAFSLVFFIQPFSAVFYPVAVLPRVARYIAYALPSTHVFEGMRAVVATGTMPLARLAWSFGLNLVYLALMMLAFYKMFGWVKKKGLLLKLDQ